jgi:uncharacterized protein
MGSSMHSENENNIIQENEQLRPGLGSQGREPDLKSIMRFYLVVFVMLLFFGSLLQGWHFELGMIATQVLIILLPAIWYWRRYRVDQTVYARLYPLKKNFIPIILLLSVSMWLLNMVIATGLVTGLMKLGFEPVVVIEPPQTMQQYLIYILVLSVFAGTCEEILFRGTIMPAMEKHGLVPAIVFSSLLFALFHGSFLSLISTFMLGVVMAVIVIKTGSLWGGILYHMLNNFYAATYLYIAGQFETTAEIDPQAYWVFLPVLIMALAGSYLGLRLLQNKSHLEPLLQKRTGLLPHGWLSLPLVAGVLIFLFLAVFEMAIGFGWLNLPSL